MGVQELVHHESREKSLRIALVLVGRNAIGGSGDGQPLGNC
jgi:hypothetical protein